MFRVTASKDLYSGVIFVVIAAIFAFSASNLKLGTAQQMGPGYVPVILCAILAALGIWLIVLGFLRTEEPAAGANLRSIAFVTGGVVAFVLVIRPLGLIPAVAICSMFMSLASAQFRLLSSLATALVLSAACWGIFIFGLHLPWTAFGPWLTRLF